MSGLTVETAVLRQPYREGDRWILDELEVGERAMKVWGWTNHYVPPQRETPRPVEPPPPLGQLELFGAAS